MPLVDPKIRYLPTSPVWGREPGCSHLTMLGCSPSEGRLHWGQELINTRLWTGSQAFLAAPRPFCVHGPLCPR